MKSELGGRTRVRPVLAVYCRCPYSERVKTRLGETIGTETARQFYILCLDLLSRELPFLSDTYDLTVCPSREEDSTWAAGVFPAGARILPQRGGGLGERLEASERDLREIGYDHIVFIGSDAPSLPVPYLRVVRRLLYERDVVFGPAQDGGVYAIGARVRLPGLREITWGSEKVFTELTDLCVRNDLSVGIAPPWYDVDTADALQRAAFDLAHSPSFARQMVGHWVNETLDRVTPMNNGAVPNGI